MLVLKCVLLHLHAFSAHLPLCRRRSGKGDVSLSITAKYRNLICYWVVGFKPEKKRRGGDMERAPEAGLVVLSNIYLSTAFCIFLLSPLFIPFDFCSIPSNSDLFRYALTCCRFGWQQRLQYRQSKKKSPFTFCASNDDQDAENSHEVDSFIVWHLGNIL